MHYLFFETTVEWLLRTFVNFRPLDARQRRFLLVLRLGTIQMCLEPESLVVTKNESSEQCQFLVSLVKRCLTWLNCVLRSLPFLSIFVYGFAH